MSSKPHSPDLHARAKAVRLVAFDIDGTLTDGRLVFDSEGRELKAFHSQDGMGIALLGWIMLSVIGPVYDVISKIKT